MEIRETDNGSDRAMSLSEPPCLRVAPDVKLGKNVRLIGCANLYGCEIGDDVKIGTFVEIQKGAKIGNRCKISSHTFICEVVRTAVSASSTRREAGQKRPTRRLCQSLRL